MEILYLDRDLCVIYKPEGLLSVPFAGYKGRTAQGVLEEQLRRRGMANRSHRPFAVHRLDRDTSGILLFALTEKAQKKMMAQWHTMVKHRVYRALAENPRDGREIAPSGVIDAPLAKNAHHVGFVPKERGAENQPDAVPARTHYKVIARGKKYTLFELELDTGKKNQIRAHLAYIGFPVAGDKEHRARENPFGRLCLHARTLEFVHPFSGELLSFEVKEPEEWKKLACEGLEHRPPKAGVPKRSGGMER